MAESMYTSLLYLSPDMFDYPERLSEELLRKVDQFVGIIGQRPTVLSDYRPGDPKTHGKGQALDLVWPSLDPLRVWSELKQAKLFSGLGIYLNDLGAVSFHVDVRPDRTATDPAIWGDFIVHTTDPDTGRAVRVDQYVGADLVIAELKKKALPALIVVGAVLLLLILRR